MVELTIKVSDDVASRLAPIHHHLPALLQQIAQAVPQDSVSERAVRPAASFPVYTQILDFLVATPSPQDIIAFKVSAETQARLGELLEKNREDTLTESEQAELDAFEQIDHIMSLLKAKANRQLKQQAHG
jgi:hypothetical protein